MTARRVVSPRSSWGLVALACGASLGAAGALAATGTGHNALFGAALGGVAAVLAVLALPSLPTRIAASLILALGGVVVVRHVRRPGSGLLLVAVWALATLVALVLVDRADLDERPRLTGGSRLPAVGREAARSTAVLVVAVLLVGALIAPILGHRPPARFGGGSIPRPGPAGSAGVSLMQNDHLDTTIRPKLGDDVVMTVSASRPEFWRGETFDHWDGRVWTRTNESAFRQLGGPGPVVDAYPVDGTPVAPGKLLTQTVHIEAPAADVVFAAAEPASIEAGRLIAERPDGTLFVVTDSLGQGALGQGATYRVVSRVPDATQATLRAADRLPEPAAVEALYGGQPVATHRVRLLARRITAHASTTYDKVRALEAWMGAHTQYSIDAPVARGNGVDVVDDFLFNVRKGWCEQISSSLVVMLRTLGIPAREATGFVPGNESRLTDEWVVRAKDAHAWAEVYFPGVGWQAFDPTAHVALAGEAKPTQSLWSWLAHHALAIVLLVVAAGLVFAGTSAARSVLRRSRNRRARSWAARRLDDLERIGADAGRPRAPAETTTEYAGALARELGESELVRVGAAIDTDAFSPEGLPPPARAEAEAVLASVAERAR